MVMTANREHAHKFEINNKGTQGRCLCGEVREYSSATDDLRTSSFKIVKAGDPLFKDPLVQVTVKQAASLGGKSAAEIMATIPDRGNREAHKNEIIADYNSMKLREFLAKWHLSTITWKKLADAWQVKRKGIGNSPFNRLHRKASSGNNGINIRVKSDTKPVETVNKPIDSDTKPVKSEIVDVENRLMAKIDAVGKYVAVLQADMALSQSKIKYLQALLTMEWTQALPEGVLRRGNDNHQG